MAVKIDKKIVGYKVQGEEKAQAPEQAVETPESNVIQMHESVERPERLVGSTYKIKPPMSEHAVYVTINDMVLNEATEHEIRRPFEVFINSKNMEHFQWVLALTRLISAVFRKGGTPPFWLQNSKQSLTLKVAILKRVVFLCPPWWLKLAMPLKIT